MFTNEEATYDLARDSFQDIQREEKDQNEDRMTIAEIKEQDAELAAQVKKELQDMRKEIADQERDEDHAREAKMGGI